MSDTNMTETRLIVVPADWPEPEQLRNSLVRCGMPFEGAVSTAFTRYEMAIRWLREFAEEVRRRVHEGHNHPARKEFFEKQGVAAKALEILRALMRTAFAMQWPNDLQSA